MFHLLEPPCSDLCSIYTLTVRSVPVTQETHDNLEPIQTVRETIENSNAEEDVDQSERVRTRPQ